MPSVTPEEVFVISDLHLGGVYGSGSDNRGFRINTHADALVAFIEEVRQRAEATCRRTEFIINGDFVDFLAEGGTGGNAWLAFIDDPDEAVDRFDAIANRDSSVFDALGSLVASGVGVTLILGNHDLELSLPPVRNRLRGRIGAGPSSNFSFVYDGEAYVIGDTLIEHGNRYDGFNVVDYDTLRRYRSECSRRLAPTPEAIFEPPLGSTLVEQVMNPIKSSYPFIDLLKPENEAAIPLLLALEPALARDVGNILDIVDLKLTAKKRSPVSPARPADPRNIAGRAQGIESGGDLVQLLLRTDTATRLAALIREAADESVRNSQRIASGKIGLALSFARLAFLTKEWEDRLQLLGDVLRDLQPPDQFSWSVETQSVYLDAAEELARGGFRNVVFGHTHAPKQVSLSNGARYLNTGTWADSMRVPPEALADDSEKARAAFARFGTAIRDNAFDDYIEFLPTFAFIRSGPGGNSLPGIVQRYQSQVVKGL